MSRLTVVGMVCAVGGLTTFMAGAAMLSFAIALTGAASRATPLVVMVAGAVALIAGASVLAIAAVLRADVTRASSRGRELTRPSTGPSRQPRSVHVS